MTRKNALIISAGAFLTVVIGCALFVYLGPCKWLSEENRQIKVNIAGRHVSGSKTVAVSEKPEQDIQPEKERVELYPSREAGDDQERKSGIQKPNDTLAVSQPSPVIEESIAESQTLREKSRRPQRSGAEKPESMEISKISAVGPLSPSGEQTQAAAVSEDTLARGDRPMIRRSAIALGVENREPIGVTQRVSVRQQRVYCWIHVLKGREGNITVHWIGKGRRIAEVHLPVGSNSWRTWAYVSLKPNMIGPARVEILDENGERLKSLSFEITE